MGLLRYAPVRPLVLWTDFPPEAGGGGAVLLRSLIAPEDRAKIVWVSPAAADGASAPHEPIVALRAGSAGRRGRRSLLLDSTVFAGALAEETLRVAEARGARAIWILLHGAGVPVAAQLVKRSALPVHATVHDDPGFGVALRSRRYFALTPWIERELGAALRGARSVDVIGDGMRARYARRFGVSSLVVHRATPGPIVPSPSYDAANGLRVAQLGNTYTYEQLPVLGRAIARAARTLGVRGRLTLMGHGFGDTLRSDLAGERVDVETTGHLDEGEAVDLLRESFALYLNYPFTWRQAVMRQTSFPTKLSTYALAARPIVAHAPEDSSLTSLASYPGYVHRWTTMSEADGAALLVRMWQDSVSHESNHVTSEAVRLRFFDPERNRSALAGALDALVSPLSGRADG